MNIKDALKKRFQYMGKSPFFYKEQINLETGEGVWLYDKAGKKYLDAYNNVPVVGHCHPKIVSSLKEQASKLNTHSRYLSEVVIDYSQKLTSLHSEELSTLQMACSGTEAVEIAITMARIYTGGVGIICSNATYHGNSHEISRMSVGPFEPEFRRVPYPQYFRPIQKNLTEDELCNLYLDEVRQEIKGFKEDGIKFAGLIFCSIFANEGLPDVPKKYLTEVSKIVREAGGVMIFDEVQAGFGRTGRWWGYQMTDTTATCSSKTCLDLIEYHNSTSFSNNFRDFSKVFFWNIWKSLIGKNRAKNETRKLDSIFFETLDFLSNLIQIKITQLIFSQILLNRTKILRIRHSSKLRFKGSNTHPGNFMTIAMVSCI
jgi:4-aminobutyrate aminotransferase-like enzyme